MKSNLSTLWRVTLCHNNDGIILETVEAFTLSITEKSFKDKQGARVRMSSPNVQHFLTKKNALAFILRRLQWLEADYAKHLADVQTRIERVQTMINDEE